MDRQTLQNQNEENTYGKNGHKIIQLYGNINYFWKRKMKHFEFGKKEPGKGSDGGKKELKKKPNRKTQS